MQFVYYYWNTFNHGAIFWIIYRIPNWIPFSAWMQGIIFAYMQILYKTYIFINSNILQFNMWNQNIINYYDRWNPKSRSFFDNCIMILLKISDKFIMVTFTNLCIVTVPIFQYSIVGLCLSSMWPESIRIREGCTYFKRGPYWTMDKMCFCTSFRYRYFTKFVLAHIYRNTCHKILDIFLQFWTFDFVK